VPAGSSSRRALVAGALFAAAASRAAAQDATPAAGDAADRPFVIGAIPDQDAALLSRQFGAMAAYLAAETGLAVEYAPVVDYAALVTTFERGDVQLAWFGGLTGVQAVALVPEARAFAQRPRDARFTSTFIAGAGIDAASLADLRGVPFTFGSESSTSGHLMPRYFLTEAGIDPESDFDGLPNYSGSHDKTIALVEAGAYQAGVLNSAVWEARLEEGAVDPAKVRSILTSPEYVDYHWTIRPDVDAVWGAGTSERVERAILGMDAADPDQKPILDLFRTDGFIPTENANYDTIRRVAEELGILR
jgi:phosphonate transport system substrate-binding protein